MNYRPSSFSCFLLSTSAFIGLFTTCLSPQWRSNAQGQTILDNIGLYDGLWKECKQVSTGQTTCQSYTIFFAGLTQALITTRILALVSIAFGGFGLILIILGMKCIRMWSEKEEEVDNKKRASGIGGFFSLSSGAFGIVTAFYFYINKNHLGGSAEQSQLLPLGSSWKVGEDVYYFIWWSTVSIIGGFFSMYSSCTWNHSQKYANNNYDTTMGDTNLGMGNANIPTIHNPLEFAPYSGPNGYGPSVMNENSLPNVNPNVPNSYHHTHPNLNQPAHDLPYPIELAMNSQVVNNQPINNNNNPYIDVRAEQMNYSAHNIALPGSVKNLPDPAENNQAFESDNDVVLADGRIATYL